MIKSDKKTLQRKCYRKVELTVHISAMVSSNTPPASSAPSPRRNTFQDRDGHRNSTGEISNTCWAIWGKIALALGSVVLPS